MNLVDTKIFEFAYRMALDDAVNQASFKGKGKGSKTRLRECSDSALVVKDYIASVLDGNNPDFYETEELVERAFAKHNTKDWHGTFTFGNAQKLINMTAKYMFISTYGNPSQRSKFDCCHCPMDTQLINWVAEHIGLLVEEYHELTPENATKMLKGYARKHPQKGNWAKLDGFSWGNMTSEDRSVYDAYQEAIRFLSSNSTILKKYLGVSSPLSPLEFDLFVWGNV